MTQIEFRQRSTGATGWAKRADGDTDTLPRVFDRQNANRFANVTSFEAEGLELTKTPPPLGRCQLLTSLKLMFM